MKSYTVTMNDTRYADMRPQIHRVIDADCARDALRGVGMPNHFMTNDGHNYGSTYAPYSVWTVSEAH